MFPTSRANLPIADSFFIGTILEKDAYWKCSSIKLLPNVTYGLYFICIILGWTSNGLIDAKWSELSLFTLWWFLFSKQLPRSASLAWIILSGCVCLKSRRGTERTPGKWLTHFSLGNTKSNRWPAGFNCWVSGCFRVLSKRKRCFLVPNWQEAPRLKGSSCCFARRDLPELCVCVWPRWYEWVSVCVRMIVRDGEKERECK